jgi:hypothetical protein
MVVWNAQGVLISNQRFVFGPHTYRMDSIASAAPVVVAPPKRLPFFVVAAITALGALVELVQGLLNHDLIRLVGMVLPIIMIVVAMKQKPTLALDLVVAGRQVRLLHHYDLSVLQNVSSSIAQARELIGRSVANG